MQRCRQPSTEAIGVDLPFHVSQKQPVLRPQHRDLVEYGSLSLTLASCHAYNDNSGKLHQGARVRMERSILVTIAISIGALIFVLELVRRRRLREEYSLLWLAIAFAMLVFSFWRDLLHGLAATVGIAYPPNLLFMLAILFVFLLMLYFSTVITRLTQENKEIAQEVALLRHELERLREQDGQQQQPRQSDAVE